MERQGPWERGTHGETKRVVQRSNQLKGLKVGSCNSKPREKVGKIFWKPSMEAMFRDKLEDGIDWHDWLIHRCEEFIHRISTGDSKK